MLRHTTVEQVVESLRPGMTVFVPGMSGESTAFYDALRARPECCAGVTFVGVLFPGINRSDYLGLSPTTRQRAYFMQPALRPGLADGRVDLLPLDYPGIVRDLGQLPAIDLAVVQLSPPDAQGVCSLGVSSDFQATVLARAHRRIGHVNPRTPHTRGSYNVRVADLDAVFEAGRPLINYDAGDPGPDAIAHARLVASLVRDGDTLEFGVGKLQSAILSALGQHRDLKVWSGMASTALLPLLDADVVRGPASVTIGVALGDDALYARTGEDDRFFFRPVSETHDVRRLAAIPQFCAINSALEVDLFGQVNAESANGRLVAGVGGLPAFVSGALLSPGGRSIIALPASTDKGQSRIVAQLPAGALAALPRQSADFVVTEHGIAALRDKSLQQRAHALIAVADPAHRETLARQWRDSIAMA